MTMLDNRQVCSFEVQDVDPRDYPDFCDAFIAYAEWEDTGEPLNEEDLNRLNEQYPELVNELAFSHYLD